MIWTKRRTDGVTLCQRAIFAWCNQDEDGKYIPVAPAAGWPIMYPEDGGGCVVPEAREQELWKPFEFDDGEKE